ncbi:MAG: hypothetical protein ACREUG_04100, partial [Steroidobacteraceae bacterium]
MVATVDAVKNARMDEIEAAYTGGTRSAGGAAAQEAACVRYGVLTTGAPLADWQKSVLAQLAQTPGAIDDGWLLPSQSPAALRERRLDFILSFAPAAVGRALGPCARWGVWQFFFGDWRAYRGESDGFWEIVDDAEVATAVLAQLQEDPDAIRILVEGAIRSHPYRPAATVAELRRRAAHWPGQLCLSLTEGSTACFETETVRTAAVVRRRRLGARLACA